MKTRVENVMKKNVTSVSPDDTIALAAKYMKENDTAFMPVVVNGGAVGAISDRDIVVRAVSGGYDPRSTKISRIMSKNIVTCRTDDTVNVAARLMMNLRIRHLLVLDKFGKLAGVLSISDLAAWVRDNRLARKLPSPIEEQPVTAGFGIYENWRTHQSK
jgi:CBS domain-containing protein